MAKSTRKGLPYSSSRVIDRSLKRQSKTERKDSNATRTIHGVLEYANVFELPDEDEEPSLIKMRGQGSDGRSGPLRYPREGSAEADDDHLRICKPEGDMQIDEDEEINSDDASSGEDSYSSHDSPVPNSKALQPSGSSPVKRGDQDSENLVELSTWLNNLPKNRTSPSSSTLFSKAAEPQKLKVEDLVQTAELQGLNSLSLAKLKRSSRVVSGVTPGTGPTPVPLPLRHQQRLEREAAYSRTKEVVKQWEPTMTSIAGAQHLSFPIQSNVEPTSTNYAQLAISQPLNDFESAIDRLIRDAKLRDTQDNPNLETRPTASNSPPSNLSPDVRSDLRRARSLLAREQAKASREARIKSKAYRKMRRRTAENGTTQEGSDNEDVERTRALERATLRHKNGSRWVSSQRKGGALFDSKRNDLTRALQRDEELRQRIAETSSNKGHRGEQEYLPLESGNADIEVVLQDDSLAPPAFKSTPSGRYHYAGQIRTTAQASVSLKETLKRTRSSADEVAAPVHRHASPPPTSSHDSAMPPSLVSNPWLVTTLESRKVPNITGPKRGTEGTPSRTSGSYAALMEVNRLMPLKGMEIEQGTAPGSGTRAVESAKPAMKQRDLVARAFADDNVVEEFREAKHELDQTSSAEAVASAIAGWGSWTGSGLKFRQREKRRPHLRPGSTSKPRRKDFGKAHVIISEKKDDKLARYQAKDLPFPFTNKAQFDRSMAAPIGSEWNTCTAHQKATLPRVSTKIGAIITPLCSEFD